MKTLYSKYRIIYSLYFILTCSVSTIAQVGIGTNSPDQSAQLEVSSTSKGLLLPRMSKSDRDHITNPATGLIIYQMDDTPGFYFHNGTGWLPLMSEPSPAIIPFSSGAPIVMASVISGLVGTGSQIGFGSSSVVTLSGPILDLSASGSNLAFSVPRSGIITSLSAFFSSSIALNLIGSSVSIRAQLYRATTFDNFFTPIPEAVVTLGPELSGLIQIGTISNGISSGLNVPVSEQDRLVLVFSISVNGSSIIIPVTGYASAGLSIK